jgi:Fe-S-cluster containining protein
MQAVRIDGCARDVARLAEALLDAGPADEAGCARLLAAVEARVQAEAALGRPAGAPAPACARGCAACCTVNVGTLALEGAAAAAFLRRRLAPAAAGALAAELLRFHERVRWLDDGERVRAGARCPLLDARGGCTIHPARPLACRALTSLDAAECRRALEDRDEEDGPGLVRQDLLQKALYDEAAAALHEVLARRGLDARHRDVSGVTGFFLADASRVAAFAAGARLALD